MPTKIFLSVGRTSTDRQEQFVSELEKFIQSQDLVPLTVGRTYFSSQQPLKAVADLMNETYGTIVVAFERLIIESGVERRGSPQQKPIANLTLPTVWNQIEAAMAYSKGHPLFMIVEENLKDEGLLERGYDWYVKRVTLERSALFDREFMGVFADWKNRVVEFEKSAKNNFSTPVEKHFGETAQPASNSEPAPAPVAKPSTAQAPTNKFRILFLTANPSDSSRLRLDHESRAIDEALRKAEFRDRFTFEQYQAVRIKDLQECLLRFKPHIVHFSGHGSSAGQILLEDNNGNSKPVSEYALGTLFSVLKDNIRVVVLNACYSEQQAKAIAQHIDCVVGMSDAVGDESAVSFSASFYQALAYGRDVQTAFELGRVQINLESLDGPEVPRLLAPNSDPKKVFFDLEERSTHA